MSFSLINKAIVITRYISAINIALKNGKNICQRGVLTLYLPSELHEYTQQIWPFLRRNIWLTGACEKNWLLDLNECMKGKIMKMRVMFLLVAPIAFDGFGPTWRCWPGMGAPLTTEQHPTLLVTSHVEKQSQKTCTIDTCIVGLRVSRNVVLRAGKNWRCSERATYQLHGFL